MTRPSPLSSKPVALALTLAMGATLLPPAQAGTAGMESGVAGQPALSAVAQREIARREEKVQQAVILTETGDKLMSEGNYEEAVVNYRDALLTLPTAPATDDFRRQVSRKFGRAAVARSRQLADEGDYDGARALLQETLLPSRDPDNRPARVLLKQLDDPVRFPPGNSPDHTEKVSEVTRLLEMGESHYLLGNFDEAEKQFNSALTIDRYNSAARGFLEKIERTRMDYYAAAYNHTRARMLREVEESWETPPPLATDFAGRAFGGDGESGVDLRARNRRKLQNIFIPTVNFQGTTLSEAVEFLRAAAKREDNLAATPEERGVNLLVREARTVADDGQRFGDKVIEELVLSRAPLGEVLKFLCDLTGMRVKIEEYAVLLVPLSEGTEDLYTRSFLVSPGFIPPVGENAGGAAAEVDPFAPAAAAGGGTVTPRQSAKDYLQGQGIPFPEGATASFDARTSTLTVRNTPQAMELIEGIVEFDRTNQPKQVHIETKFVEVQQRNGKELGFDWLLGPSIVDDGNGIIAAGGVSGNGVPTQAADYAILDPLTTGGTNPLPLGRNPVTAANRSGDFGITRNAVDSILNSTIADVGADVVAPGVLTIAGLLTEPQFQVVMRALDQKKGTDLLSAPSVTTRSGLPARIEIIREFIYPTEYDPPELPNRVVTTSSGNERGSASSFPVTPANPTAFETRNTGVTLEVDPTVAQTGYTIDLNLAPEVVEFQGFINYGNPITSPAQDALGRPSSVIITENRIEMPVFSTRRVKTQVTVWDGQTVAIGGLIREDVQDVEDKIPLLGDIPMAGRLFKTVSENRFKRNLMVFVTARLIDPAGNPVNDFTAPTPPIPDAPESPLGGGLFDGPAEPFPVDLGK